MKSPNTVCWKPAVLFFGWYMMRSSFFLKGYSDKCDAAAGLVDLPHVQLLVLFQGLLELGRGEAPRDATLLCFSHTHHPASAAAACHALCGELAHQREDNIRWPLSPGQKIKSSLYVGRGKRKLACVLFERLICIYFH